MRPILLLALPLALVAAERVELTLKDGRRLVGTVVAEDAERVTLETRMAGRKGDMVVRLPLAVAEITGRTVLPSPAEEYAQRRAAAEDTPAAQMALASWCRDQALAEQAIAHATRAWELDHQNAAAIDLLHALGRWELDGAWITEAEYLARTGKVRWRDRFVTTEEAAKLQAEAEAAAQAEAAQGAVEAATIRLARITDEIAGIEKQLADLAKQKADAGADRQAAERDGQAYESARKEEEAAQKAVDADSKKDGKVSAANQRRLDDARAQVAKAKRARDEAQRRLATAKATEAAATRRSDQLTARRKELEAERARAQEALVAATRAAQEPAKP